MFSLATITFYRQFLIWTTHWKVVFGCVTVCLNAWVNRLMTLLHSDGVITVAATPKIPCCLDQGAEGAN